MLLFALVAGLIGELWLKPSPLLTAEVLEESDVVEPFGTFDFSNDGWLDWVSHTMNPSYKASLVVNMLPDDSSRAEADFQFYFPGKHVVGQADPVQAATGILIHTTSRTDSTVWFSRLTIDKEGHSSREDTLLFDGTRADLSNIAFPAICGLPIRFPGTSRLLIPLWGNFMAWRGAVITDMQDFSHLTLVPAGVGMSLADTLAVRMPDGRQLLLAYGSGSNNGNTLGGFPDTGSWMFLVDPDSGIVRHRHMAAFKSMRATLFPDQRHVMLTGGQLYDGQEATPTLLVWDSWTDSLALAEKLPLQNPTQPVRCGDELLWFDGEHQVWVATPSQLRARKLYELPLSRFATVRSSGDSWVIWDGANMALVRCHDGRLLMRLPSSIKGGRVWLEQPPAADLPRRLTWLRSTTQIGISRARTFVLQPVSFIHRWITHPFLLASLLPGIVVFLLLLGIRMFAQERLLRRLVPQQEAATGLLDDRNRLVYANDLLEEILEDNGDRIPDPEWLLAQPMEAQYRGRDLRWSMRQVPRRFGSSWIQLMGNDVTHARENEQQRLFLMKLAVMAHDLKAPLTPIRLQAEGIEDALPMLPPEVAGRVRHALGEIDRQVERSLQLITRFMGMARTEFELSPVSLPDIARAAMSELESMGWPELDTRLVYDSSVSHVAEAEGDVLQLALFELLLNAAQSMEGRGRLLLTLSSGPEGSTLRVEDNGPGIPEANLARVLEPGYTTRAKGTGFGLYFVKRVLERMGGDLLLSNSGAGGLTAIVTFKGQSSARS